MAGKKATEVARLAAKLKAVLEDDEAAKRIDDLVALAESEPVHQGSAEHAMREKAVNETAVDLQHLINQEAVREQAMAFFDKVRLMLAA